MASEINLRPILCNGQRKIWIFPFYIMRPLIERNLIHRTGIFSFHRKAGDGVNFEKSDLFLCILVTVFNEDIVIANMRMT
jgi:hypothetical protein